MPRSSSNIGRYTKEAKAVRRRRANRSDEQRSADRERARIRTAQKRAKLAYQQEKIKISEHLSEKLEVSPQEQIEIHFVKTEIIETEENELSSNPDPMLLNNETS